MFVETSAKSGDNVEEVFVKIARTILQQIETGPSFPLLVPLQNSFLLYIIGVVVPDNMSSGVQVGNKGAAGSAPAKIVKTKNPQLTAQSAQDEGGCSC